MTKKVRHVIHIDQDVDDALREQAAALRMPPAVLLRGIVSAHFTRRGAVTSEVMPVTSEVMAVTSPKLLTSEDTGGHGGDLACPESAPPDAAHRSSSSLVPDPEETKTKRPTLTDEEKKARAEGKARKAEADRLFDEALRAYSDAGGRVDGAKGNPHVARRRWHDFRLQRGVEASDLLARVLRFVAATRASSNPFWPGFAEVLLERNNYLSDEALAAREKRARQERQTTPGAQGAFEVDAYDERIARARRASDPIPRPSAGATRPARAGGLPDAPQAPAPVRP